MSRKQGSVLGNKTQGLEWSSSDALFPKKSLSTIIMTTKYPNIKHLDHLAREMQREREKEEE